MQTKPKNPLKQKLYCVIVEESPLSHRRQPKGLSGIDSSQRLPACLQSGVPFVCVPTFRCPCSFTHQHLFLFGWHCTSWNLPSGIHFGGISLPAFFSRKAAFPRNVYIFAGQLVRMYMVMLPDFFLIRRICVEFVGF